MAIKRVTYPGGNYEVGKFYEDIGEVKIIWEKEGEVWVGSEDFSVKVFNPEKLYLAPITYVSIEKFMETHKDCIIKEVEIKDE